MGTFTISAPDGKSYTIEGDNAIGALAALKKHLGEAPPDVGYGEDSLRGVGAGALQGTAGMAGALGDVRSLISGGADALGIPESVKNIAGKAAQLTPFGSLAAIAPTSQDISHAIGDQSKGVTGMVTGAPPGRNALGRAMDYQPQTLPGQYARTAGEFLPAAIGGPEGIGARMLSRVALPALGSEGAGQLTKGTSLEPYARIAGAFAGPGIETVARRGLAPIFANIEARRNPTRYAEGQVSRGIAESGRAPDDIAFDVSRAASEGQPQFALADAMGNPGQELLGTAARGPGEGRTNIVNTLDSRQAGQGRRVVNALAEGFDAPQTAAQTRDTMTAARGSAADAEYSAVRNGAVGSQVDVVPTINNLDRNIGTMPGQQLQAPNDSIESVLRPYRERLARVDPNDFEAVSRIRSDMADAAQNARQSGYGNRARLIGQAVRELDAGMENASPGYRQANANFRQRTQDINAIDLGRNAATRGRPEDTVPNFRAQSSAGQNAFRAGYADPLIEQTQGAAIGVNKARPLTNDAFQDEAAAIAPMRTQAMMQRRLARENTMFETRATALGGSPTAKNLAHDAAAGIDPHLVGQILSGQWHGAVRSVLAAGRNFFTGNTPEVRREVARILLQNGTSLSAPQLRDMVNRTVQRIQFVQRTAAGMRRNAAIGAAVAAPAQLDAEQSR